MATKKTKEKATEKNSRSSISLVMGLAALSVIVALYIVFGRATDEIAPSELAPAASPRPVSNPDSLAASVPSEALEPDTLQPPQAPTNPPIEMPPIEEIPKDIAEAFKRGTAPISDAAREEMRTGMREMPPEIRAEMEGAPDRPIPTELLHDFENPFPAVSQQELEMLHQNGLNPGTP